MTFQDEAVKKAEQSIRSFAPVEERGKMIIQPPIQDPAQRLKASVENAKASVEDMIRWYSRNGANPGALRELSKAIREEADGTRQKRELDYLTRAMGNPQPRDVMPTREAALAYCQKRLQHDFDLVTSLLPPPGFAYTPPPPVAGAMARATANPFFAENENIGADAASRMLTTGFFGPWVGGRFKMPVIVTPPQEYFEVFKRAFGTDALGMYLPGTNVILVSPQVKDRDIRREVILHEMLHYSAHLGGGCVNIRWRDERNQPILKSIPWLEEGMTQLHTKELLIGNKSDSPSIAYPAETLVALHIQKLAGNEAVRRAYLTGDYSEVREAVDRKLGKGSFDSIMGMGRPGDALAEVRGLSAHAGIDPLFAETGPIASGCLMALRAQKVN